MIGHVQTLFTEFTKFTETTIVDDNDGISKHTLTPISPTFYNIALIIDDN